MNNNNCSFFLKDARPKDVLNLTELNAVFVELEKTGKENSLQLTIVHQGTTRNYFVYSESGQVRIGQDQFNFLVSLSSLI